MTLSEFIKSVPEGTEVTVYDDEYDMETYFYNDRPEDDWDRAMWKLAKALTVSSHKEYSAFVNLSEIVRSHLAGLDEAGLFIKCDTDAIMDDMMNILAGNVSERWLTKFADVLCR